VVRGTPFVSRSWNDKIPTIPGYGYIKGHKTPEKVIAHTFTILEDPPLLGRIMKKMLHLIVYEILLRSKIA